MWSLQGRVFDFAVTDVVFLVVLMIILRRPSAAACARLVRWQLMHRWPGASAQFEHLWGQRIGILSMYDSRANGLLRLLGMKLPSPGWCVHLHGVAVEVLRLESLESTSILWAGKGRPSQDVGLWWTFCVSSMSLCVIVFACWRWILAWSVRFLATSLSSGFSVVRCSATMLGSPLMDSCHWTCLTACFYARAWCR